jgi:hypothetical protein
MRRSSVSSATIQPMRRAKRSPSPGAKLAQNGRDGPSWLVPKRVQRTLPLSSCVRARASGIARWKTS